jgi:2,4-dienoyl-CoA reductase-like NADH-dependent reductase (Old Yellow Enzyme family)
MLTAGEADAVAFGKLCLAYPGLPHRFAPSVPLNAWNAVTFYAEGPVGLHRLPSPAEAAE